MDVLAEAELWRWLKEAWPSLAVLVVAAGVAFAVGMLLQYRRSKIQRQYQDRVERERQEDAKP